MGAELKRKRTVRYALANSFVQSCSKIVRALDGSARKRRGW
jgi:hypothetical protein